jgi:hypothetical protein
METQKEEKKIIRNQIMKSAINSFKIEGINIPLKKAEETLKKVEISLEK